MVKASALFSAADRKAIEAAVGQAEQGTVVEIVPVVASVSGRYDRAADLCGLTLALLALLLYWWLGPLPAGAGWAEGAPNTPLWPLPLIVLGGFLAGAVAASRVPALRLPFLTRGEMQVEVERAARAAFQGQRVRATREATGVLVYLSLYEHMVHVLGDDAVAERIPAERFQPIVDQIVAAMRSGTPAAGLVKALGSLGELLRETMAGEDRAGNELHDGLILIDPSD